MTLKWIEATVTRLGWSGEDWSSFLVHLLDLYEAEKGGIRTSRWKPPVVLNQAQRVEVEDFYRRLYREEIPLEAGGTAALQVAFNVLCDYVPIDHYVEGQEVWIDEESVQAIQIDFVPELKRLGKGSLIDVRDLDPRERTKNPSYLTRTTTYDRQGRSRVEFVDNLKAMYDGFDPPHLTRAGKAAIHLWLRHLAKTTGSPRLTLAAEQFLLAVGVAAGALQGVAVERIHFKVKTRHLFVGASQAVGWTLEATRGQLAVGGRMALWGSWPDFMAPDNDPAQSSEVPQVMVPVEKAGRSFTFLQGHEFSAPGRYQIRYYPPGEPVTPAGGVLAWLIFVADPVVINREDNWGGTIQRVPLITVGKIDADFVEGQEIGYSLSLYRKVGKWPRGAQISIAPKGIPKEKILNESVARVIVDDVLKRIDTGPYGKELVSYDENRDSIVLLDRGFSFPALRSGQLDAEYSVYYHPPYDVGKEEEPDPSVIGNIFVISHVNLGQ